MKAVLLDAPGPPSSLRIGELADPVPSPDEVLVRVQAASLNPVDFKIAAIGSELWTYPQVLGVDAAGVIEQVGGNVTDWRPGDRVLYHTTWRRHGTYAELSTVPGHDIGLGGVLVAPQFRRQQEDLAKMASEMISLVQRAAIRSTVSQVISLDEIPQSLAILAEGHVRGKIVAQV